MVAARYAIGSAAAKLLGADLRRFRVGFGQYRPVNIKRQKRHVC